MRAGERSPRASCPWCGGFVPISDDGCLRRHGRSSEPGSWHCLGSREPAVGEWCEVCGWVFPDRPDLARHRLAEDHYS